MGSVRWRTAIGRPLFFFSQEITIRLIKKDKGVMEDKKLTMPMIALRGLTVLPQMTVKIHRGGGAGDGGRSASISGDAEAAG